MLVGLTGRAQHGKDTLGGILVEEFGFKRYAFADQLKSMALVLNPYVDSKYSQRLYTLVQDAGWDNAKLEPEVRRFLQVLGTEAVRDHLGADAWINALEKKLDDDGLWDPQGPAYGSRIVVTDVRFPNEAEWISKFGGVLWRLRRLNLDDTVFDNGLGDHPSEAHIDSLKADTEIIARTVDELHMWARQAGAAFERP